MYIYIYVYVFCECIIWTHVHIYLYKNMQVNQCMYVYIHAWIQIVGGFSPPKYAKTRQIASSSQNNQKTLEIPF